ncbi:uncharacterized protein LOC141729423 [Zonotrichia albicollis]|uniref:uncharacterized protein LOC141729423 n=1 Tax=Zonotrichia albicollis TaxID=44394 RepID=UPI003D811AA1
MLRTRERAKKGPAAPWAPARSRRCASLRRARRTKLRAEDAGLSPEGEHRAGPRCSPRSLPAGGPSGAAGPGPAQPLRSESGRGGPGELGLAPAPTERRRLRRAGTVPSGRARLRPPPPPPRPWWPARGRLRPGGWCRPPGGAATASGGGRSAARPESRDRRRGPAAPGPARRRLPPLPARSAAPHKSVRHPQCTAWGGAAAPDPLPAAGDPGSRPALRCVPWERYCRRPRCPPRGKGRLLLSSGAFTMPMGWNLTSARQTLENSLSSLCIYATTQNKVFAFWTLLLLLQWKALKGIKGQLGRDKSCQKAAVPAQKVLQICGWIMRINL